MARPWVKLWTDVLDNRRLARAGEAADWLFVRLVLICAEGAGRGVIENGSAEDIAWRLRKEPLDIEARLVALEQAGAIKRKCNRITLLGWDTRQLSNTDAERARRYRARRHVITDRDASRDVTVASRSRHALEGEGEGDREVDGDGDVEQTKRETEGEPPAPDSPSPAKAPKPSRKRPGIRRPDDLRPDQTARDLASQLGVNVEAEFPKFCDHHDAKGSLFSDWQAALRTWTRNAARFAERGSVIPIRQQKTRSQRIIEAAENVVRRLEQSQEEGA